MYSQVQNNEHMSEEFFLERELGKAFLSLSPSVAPRMTYFLTTF